MLRHHQEQSTLAQRSEKEELQRLKKIASTIAKEVKHFWESVRKVRWHLVHVILRGWLGNIGKT